MIRKDILDAATNYVCVQREEEYGTPEDNFHAIAVLWSYWLGVPVNAHDVPIMMALLKIARIKTGQTKDDNYIDGCGYLACAGEIRISSSQKLHRV